MNNLTFTTTSSKPPRGPLSKTDFLGALIAANQPDLLATRLALDFLLEEQTPLPPDIPVIYDVFCTQLDIEADYSAFKRHRLQGYLCKNYNQIQSWLPSLGLPVHGPKRVRFWQLSGRLIYQHLIDHTTGPTLSAMIWGLSRLPTIIQAAFPGIQNPKVLQRFQTTL